MIREIAFVGLILSALTGQLVNAAKKPVRTVAIVSTTKTQPPISATEPGYVHGDHCVDGRAF